MNKRGLKLLEILNVKVDIDYGNLLGRLRCTADTRVGVGSIIRVNGKLYYLVELDVKSYIGSLRKYLLVLDDDESNKSRLFLSGVSVDLVAWGGTPFMAMKL